MAHNNQYVDDSEDPNDDPFALLNEAYIDNNGDVMYSVTIPDYFDNIESNSITNIKVELDNEQIMQKFENSIQCTLKNETRNKTKINLRDVAAKVIQRYWRNYIDQMIFKYVQNILYNCIQNPLTIMKNINPIESQFLDVASGTFIRYRLCGKSFPPKIVYKIFTVRPVISIGDLNYKKEQKLIENIPQLKRGKSNLPSTSFRKNENHNFNEWRICVDTSTNILKKLQQLKKIKQRKKVIQTPNKNKSKTKMNIEQDSAEKVCWIKEILREYSQAETDIDEFTDYLLKLNEK